MNTLLGRSLVLVLWGLGTQVIAEEAVLHAVIKDKATGRLTACTVTLTDARGRTVIDNEAFRGGFRCPGEFTKSLPAGRTTLRVARGLETKAIQTDLSLRAGQTNELELELERLVDLRQRGWYAGDSHVHMLHGERTLPVSFDDVALSARAEDLQYLCLAQSWTLSPATPEALAKELGARSTKESWLTWNLEAPKNYYQGDAARCLGHCWNLGMRGRTPSGRNVIADLLEASAWDYESEKPTYANFESHSLIHRQGGVVFYTHPARWWLGSWGGQGKYPRVEQMKVSNMAVELPLDVLIGPTFDGLDVLTGPGEHEANSKAFQIWALLLNHGYRLTPTASSDACFDRPGGGIPGAARTYTFLKGKFSFSSVARAMAAGRTFATTGPLLLVSVDDDPPGTVFRPTPKRRALRIEAWASGDTPVGLQRVQILRNGAVLQDLILRDQPFCFRTNATLVETGKAWYCVRTFEGDSQNRLAVSGAFYFNPGEQGQPAPVPVRLRVRVVDADSGKGLDATLTEVSFAGTQGRDLRQHQARNGLGELTLPGTVRLRADCNNYLSQTLSPVLDNPRLIETITHFSDSDLLDWASFEKVRAQLSDVQLVFKLKRK